MMRKITFSLLFLGLASLLPAQDSLTADWLRTHLKPGAPRLFFTPQTQERLPQVIRKNALAAAYYALLEEQANALLQAPVLERRQEGRRLLGVSREALRRLSTLSLLCRLDSKEAHLRRLEQELEAVCRFSDWNPSHFLDVAEMALGVAIAVDWAGEMMRPEVRRLARQALLDKALLPSLEEADYNWWITTSNNWNQVCHSGLTATAIVLADEHPELTARILQRSITQLPLALHEYAPDGAYPEGPSYWIYGTGFNVLLIDMLQSAFGRDFGLSAYPGFLESAVFWRLSKAPSGLVYNYADCNASSGRGLGGDQLMIWFSRRTGNAALLEPELLLEKVKAARAAGKNADRLSSIALVWLAAPPADRYEPLPTAWQAGGPNPVAVVRGSKGFYLAAKGGAASVNHGNMDAGSFILEWKGVRWSIDPGNQNYNELEQLLGGGLWDRSQYSPRWKLLTKNNFHHSTLTINDSLHRVEGYAPVDLKKDSDQTTVSIDLTAVFKGMATQVLRSFLLSSGELRIVDTVQANEQSRSVTWSWLTQAEVEKTETGLRLRQDGQELLLDILQPTAPHVEIIALDPPPLSYDKRIEGLKRIEIRLQKKNSGEGKEVIAVRIK